MRRGHFIRPDPLVNPEGEEPLSTGKAFDIPKRLVWDAYVGVRQNAGSAGVDGQCMEAFEANLKDNPYKIWNRMSSGSYMPPLVLRVENPKADGGVRQLGIPAIGDRIAQAAVKRYLEPLVEPYFHEDSYGYRPGRSALDAVATARQCCWRKDWVLDLDIRRFLDTLDHALVLRAVRRFTTERRVLLYVERWLQADVQLPDGTVLQRDQGTPQGGVISPLLANIFLHLGFDQWMREHYPAVGFERYADYIVVHCRSRREVESIQASIGRRLAQCRLALHPDKTRVVYCKDTRRTGQWGCQSFDFLGYTFRPRSSRNYRGELFVSLSPAMSRKSARSLRQIVRRRWRLKQRAHLSLNALARRLNPIISGWINYYGRFRRSELHTVLNHINLALTRWVMRKFKRFARRRTQAYAWLRAVARRSPTVFAHWQYQGWMTRAV